jgi:methyl acetate hydrolase
MHLSRRVVLSLPFAASAAVPRLNTVKLDALLRQGIERRGIPAVSAAIATDRETLYSAAFGVRDKASRQLVDTRSIFGIASMTKAITTAAALQLVEQGKLSLRDPIGKFLPELSKLQVLAGFESGSGKPLLRPAKLQPTVHHLLTHTAGFAYDNWNPDLLRLYQFQGHAENRPAVPPLLTDPGTRWEYGTNIDWAGRIVEAISGMSLEAYFQKHILQPLGMNDTSYLLTPEKFPRKVITCRRQPDDSLREDPAVVPPPPTSFNGGGGLYSTPADYVRFMQMILQRGGGILKPASVAPMARTQTGTMSAGKMQTARPENSSDVDFHPGEMDGFTYGFLINPKAYRNGRSAGSLAWAGIQNTFYWIDPQRKLCATIMMQFYPFCDREAVGLLRDFEAAIYG